MFWFYRYSVDSILSKFTKIIDKLEKHSAKANVRSNKHAARSERLNRLSAAYDAESQRAIAVAAKIRSLIG